LLTARQLAARPQNHARGGETCQVSAGEAGGRGVVLVAPPDYESGWQRGGGVFYTFCPRWYNRSMKIKTSITLTEDLVQAIDEYSDQFKNRSAFLETAAWAFVDQLQRAERDAQDIEIINRRTEYLNDEVMDVLTYQVSL